MRYYSAELMFRTPSDQLCHIQYMVMAKRRVATVSETCGAFAVDRIDPMQYAVRYNGSKRDLGRALRKHVISEETQQGRIVCFTMRRLRM